MRLKNCEICQKKFEPSKYNPYQLYCSKICNSKAYYHRNLIERLKKEIYLQKKKNTKKIGLKKTQVKSKSILKKVIKNKKKSINLIPFLEENC